jgi:hypothetical protein
VHPFVCRPGGNGLQACLTQAQRADVDFDRFRPHGDIITYILQGVVIAAEGPSSEELGNGGIQRLFSLLALPPPPKSV